jgi:hypothetical protein
LIFSQTKSSRANERVGPVEFYSNGMMGQLILYMNDEHVEAVGEKYSAPTHLELDQAALPPETSLQIRLPIPMHAGRCSMSHD